MRVCLPTSKGGRAGGRYGHKKHRTALSLRLDKLDCGIFMSQSFFVSIVRSVTPPGALAPSNSPQSRQDTGSPLNEVRAPLSAYRHSADNRRDQTRRNGKERKTMAKLIIRRESPEDYAAVEVLTRAAFYNVYQPGCDEHLIVHKMRSSPDCIPALCHVALWEGRLAGHILYSRAWIESASGTRREVALFGPISVLPALQRRGVGSAMIRHTLPLARRMGFGGVVITGNPAYYHRFGFDDAAKFGIVMEDGTSMPELMALELIPGGLSGPSGRVHFSPLYTVDARELAAFDKKFAKEG